MKEMGKPLISVVLPFYNAPFLKEAIQSILNQTFTDFELILINNGSTDESLDVARVFEVNPKVILLNQPRRGVVFAANKGIEAAQGDFIARMDADDISYVYRLELQIKMLLSDPSIGAVSGLVDYEGSKKNEGFIHYVDWLNRIISHKDIYLNQFVEFPIANPTLMIRREIYEKYGYYEEGTFPEDYDFFLRLQSNDIKMEKLTKPILKWRDTPTRLTRTDDRYSQEAFFKIKARYLAKWLRKNNPFHPMVYIWGAGRLSRRRCEWLLHEGVSVVNYIDIKPTDQVLDYKELPDKDTAFIVSYVSNRGARERIRAYLIQNGYVEGINFILAA